EAALAQHQRGQVADVWLVVGEQHHGDGRRGGRRTVGGQGDVIRTSHGGDLLAIVWGPGDGRPGQAASGVPGWSDAKMSGAGCSGRGSVRPPSAGSGSGAGSAGVATPGSAEAGCTRSGGGPGSGSKPPG